MYNGRSCPAKSVLIKHVFPSTKISYPRCTPVSSRLPCRPACSLPAVAAVMTIWANPGDCPSVSEQQAFEVSKVFAARQGEGKMKGFHGTHGEISP